MSKLAQGTVLLLAGLVGLLLGLPATAQDKPSQADVVAAYQRGQALSAAGKYAEAIKEYEKAVALAERVFGPNDVNTATLVNNLADLYGAQGQYAQAEPLFQRALQIYEAQLGKDHPLVATALNNLASLYQAQGQYAQAEPLFQRSLQIYEAKLGKDHPHVATTFNNLAALYKDQGQYAQAEPLYQRALQIKEAQLGKDHPDVATTLNGLALLYQAQGQYAQAEPFFLRALQINEAKLGKDHPHVAAALNNLAALLQEQGQYAQAEPLLQRALQIYEAKLGKDHPDVAKSLNNLAGLYLNQGQYAQAEPLYQRALQIREAKLGKDHPDVAMTLNKLASLYGAQGQYAQAEPLYRRALQINEAKLGKDHPDVATTLHNLAWLYQEQGQYAQAEPLYRRALQIYEAKLGKDHPDVATTLNGLALLYQAQGEYAQAEPFFLRALQIYEAKLGKDHPHVAAALNNLAQLYEDQGQYAQAEPLYQRALQIREAKLGKDHPDVAMTLNNLASLYGAQGQYAQAESLYRRALQIYEAKLGKDHPHVATTLNNLAELHRAQGEYAQAEPLYQRALQIEEAKLGKDHPHVAAALNNLALLYEDQGQYAQAEPLFLRALQIKEAKLGKDHPLVATALSNLVLLYVGQQDWDKAAATADRACRTLRRHVAQVLPALPEPDQLTFLHRNHDPFFHGALSLALRRRTEAEMPAHSAAWLLNGKAVAQQALVERTLLALASQDPDLQATARQLLAVRGQLAHLTFAPFKPGEDANRRQELERLAAQERDLSKKLGQAAGRPVREDPWVEVDEVRKVLPNGAVFIDLAKFDVWDFKERKWQAAHYAAWVIPPVGKGTVQLIDLGEAEKIDAAVAAARHALQNGPRQVAKLGEARAEQELAPTLQALSKLVLQPLREHIDQAEQWIISPDATLWLFPWEALPLAEGTYAIEKHRIRYVVSGRDLVLPVRAQETTAPLVLADPDFDLGLDQAQAETRNLLKEGALRGKPRPSGALGDARFPRLPGTAAEAKAIAPKLQRYSQMEPRLYTDNQALEGVFKAASRPKVLVLCTHGFFLPDQDDAIDPRPFGFGDRGVELTPLTPPPSTRPKDKPGKPRENPLLRCGLALAGANNRAQATEATEDGVLTGLEIVGTDLRGTELVVLSACETGLGELRNGEGVASLRQAFQLAGARTVVATLWKIPDKETAQLVSAFFDNLATGQAKAEALRQAQLALIEERRAKSGAAHPFYWAAFTLTGQGQ